MFLQSQYGLYFRYNTAINFKGSYYGTLSAWIYKTYTFDNEGHFDGETHLDCPHLRHLSTTFRSIPALFSHFVKKSSIKVLVDTQTPSVPGIVTLCEANMCQRVAKSDAEWRSHRYKAAHLKLILATYSVHRSMYLKLCPMIGRQIILRNKLFLMRESWTHETSISVTGTSESKASKSTQKKFPGPRNIYSP